MYEPAKDNEITTLVRYLDQQLDAIRASAFGLTEEQSRETPCRSTLSIAGIIKHTTYGMRGAVARLGNQPLGPFQERYTEFMASFDPSEATTQALLEDFDNARSDYLGALASSDPDADAAEPPAPWFGRSHAKPIRLRYYVSHQLEEMARHAGHADIIREQLDGMAVPTLVLTIEGAPANDFFQPYEPQPGTLR